MPVPSRDPGATGPKAAVVMSATGVTLSYDELIDHANRVADALRSLGLREGDGVAVLLENRPEWFEIIWATRRSGLYLTPVNTHLAQDEVDYIVRDSGARVVFVSPPLAHLVPEGAVEHVVIVGGDGTTGDGTTGDGALDYGGLLAAGSPQPVISELPGSEMFYSSGTTGRPKGIKRPLASLDDAHPIVQSLSHARDLYGQTADSVYLLPAPMYHAAPLVGGMTVHQTGGTVILMAKFDAAEALDAIERHRVTHAQFVPTMFVRMLRLPEHERYDVSSLQAVVHAAAPCPAPTKQAMLDWWGPVIHEYYNATEAFGGTRITPEEWLAHPGSVGQAPATLHVLDEHFDDVGPGVPGTIWFETQSKFEYHNDTAKTIANVSPQGYRTVGDIGYLDEDRYLFLTDRATFMIVSGGVNIYPQEIEAAMIQHPGVGDVAVFGVPNAEFGEEVKAVVQPSDPAADHDVLRDELVEFCRASLASYKQPRSIEFLDVLPRDPNGK
ncbi:MAG: AMP-binding protein, partial [Ilumatobacteraceae bacterium]